MGRRIAALVLLVAGLGPGVQSAVGQIVGGTISGQVKDSSGAAIAGATVTVRNVDMGATRTITTSADGHYAAPSVPVGGYTVSIARAGFQTQQRESIFLAIGQTVTVNMTLGVGTVQQKVTVSAEPAGVNTTTHSTSGEVTTHQLETLPINGRSYDELLTQNPAAVNFNEVKSGGAGSSPASLGNSFSISGRRPQDNIFLLNGIEYSGANVLNLVPGGVSGVLLGIDSVREFNTMSDAYGSAYGKRDGAQTSIVTMSGTNALHGDLFEQFRDNALNARNYFDQGSTPNFLRNQFGGAVGGPIRKNKLFLFGNYEGYRQSQNLTSVSVVPDTEARQGYLPDTTGTEQKVGLGTGVAPLFALWPAQNGPELTANGLPTGMGEAYTNPPSNIRDDFGTTRFDDNLGGRDLLFAAYTIDDSGADTTGPNPLTRVESGLREQVLSVQEQHVFSPSVLNTARLGYSRGSYGLESQPPVDLPGFVVGRQFGTMIIAGSTSASGASQLTQAGSSAGTGNTSSRNLFTLDDHTYWSRGSNQLEAGLWMQIIESNDDYAQNRLGQASFATLPAFLAGTIYTFGVIPQPTEIGWRTKEYAGFAEDIWKATQRLELRGGVRIESTNGWNAAHGMAANYAVVDGVVQTDPFTGSSALLSNHAKELFSPRFGFAWDVRGNGKTAVRGGVGLYHTLLDALDYRLDQGGPFNEPYSIKGLTVATASIPPGGTLPGTSLVSPGTVQPNIDTPAVINWTLRVEQQVAPRTTVTVGYVGSHAYHQILSEDLNQPVPSYLPDGTAYYPSGVKNANPLLSKTTSWVSQGVGLYNALRVDVRHNLGNGVQFRGIYTYAKNLDDGSAIAQGVATAATPAFVEFPLQPKMDWGLASTDVRHQAAVNGSWDLDAGLLHGVLANSSSTTRSIAGGWTVSGVFNFQTGLPFTPQLGYNPTGNGDSRNPIRPDWNPTFAGPLYPHTPGQWFDANAFTTPAAGYYGNVQRDALTGPNATQLDFAAIKNVPLEHSVRLQFRADFYNLLNHTNFQIPNEIVYAAATGGVSPTGGLITATSTASRQIQFGARMSF
ncbi:MAG TPA: carboxypeptidase-like regulatory domain-containing protein [Acidobacteriaceae bacterium]|jgi:hypothetical protein|nr:carboxypeptidase-like regulatory domain-containing protein [Acidobacteriaceae bacterium]